MTKIKSIITHLITDQTGEDGILYMNEVRDEEGNILLHEQYDIDGSVAQKSVRQYDEKGKLTYQEEYTINEGPDQRLHFYYQESGKLDKVRIVYMDDSESIKSYTRDEAENSLSTIIVDDEGDEEGREFRKFDQEGRILEETIHEDGALNRHEKVSYDDAGRPVERHTTDAEGFSNSFFYFYELNEKGQFSEIEIANEKDELTRADFFEYDERGNEIVHRIENHKEGYVIIDHQEWNMDNLLTQRKRTLGDGKLIEEVNYKYNDHKLIEEEEHISRDGVYTHRYTYEVFS